MSSADFAIRPPITDESMKLAVRQIEQHIALERARARGQIGARRRCRARRAATPAPRTAGARVGRVRLPESSIGTGAVGESVRSATLAAAQPSRRHVPRAYTRSTVPGSRCPPIADAVARAPADPRERLPGPDRPAYGSYVARGAEALDGAGSRRARRRASARAVAAASPRRSPTPGSVRARSAQVAASGGRTRSSRTSSCRRAASRGGRVGSRACPTCSSRTAATSRTPRATPRLRAATLAAVARRRGSRVRVRGARRSAAGS